MPTFQNIFTKAFIGIQEKILCATIFFALDYFKSQNVCHCQKNEFLKKTPLVQNTVYLMDRSLIT